MYEYLEGLVYLGGVPGHDLGFARPFAVSVRLFHHLGMTERCTRGRYLFRTAGNGTIGAHAVSTCTRL